MWWIVRSGGGGGGGETVPSVAEGGGEPQPEQVHHHHLRHPPPQHHHPCPHLFCLISSQPWRQAPWRNRVKRPDLPTIGAIEAERKCGCKKNNLSSQENVIVANPLTNTHFIFHSHTFWGWRFEILCPVNTKCSWSIISGTEGTHIKSIVLD